MAALVSAIYALTLVVDETIALSLTYADDKPIRHELPAQSGVLNASSSPPATKVFSGVVTIASGGIVNLDLTALPDPVRGTIDFTGLRVQVIMLSAFSANVDTVTLKTKDTTTGYNLFGVNNTGSEEETLSLGQGLLKWLNDKPEDVDATHKDISFTGSTGNSVNVLLVAG